MIDHAYVLKAQKWIDEQQSDGATRLDMQDAARELGNEQPELAMAILDNIGHPMDDLIEEASALARSGNRQDNAGTFMMLPAIVNCSVDKCRRCGVEFVVWHVWRSPEPFVPAEISGRLAVKFCPSCGKEWW